MSEQIKVHKSAFREDNKFYKLIPDILERIASHGVVHLPPRRNKYNTLTLPLTIHSSIELYKTTGKIFVSLVKGGDDEKLSTGGIKKKEIYDAQKSENMNKYTLSFQIKKDSDEYKLLDIIHKKSDAHIRNLIKERIKKIKGLMNTHNYNPNLSNPQNSKAMNMLDRDLRKIDADQNYISFITDRDIVSLGNLLKKKNLLRPLISRWVPENSTEPRYYIHFKVAFDVPIFLNKDGVAAKSGDTQFKVFSSFNPLTGKPKYNLIQNPKIEMLSDSFTGRVKNYEVNQVDFTIGQIQYATRDSQETFLFQKSVAKKVFINKFIQKTKEYEEGERITNLTNFLDNQENEIQILENQESNFIDDNDNIDEKEFDFGVKPSLKRKRDENDKDEIEPDQKKNKN